MCKFIRRANLISPEQAKNLRDVLKFESSTTFHEICSTGFSLFTINIFTKASGAAKLHLQKRVEASEEDFIIAVKAFIALFRLT